MKSLGCTQMRGWKPQGGWSWVSLHAGAEPRPQDESAGCPWTRGAAVGGGHQGPDPRRRKRLGRLGAWCAVLAVGLCPSPAG